MTHLQRQYTPSRMYKEKKIVEQLKQGKTTLEIYGFDRLIQKLS